MEKLVNKLVDYINNGKIVSFPTETVYALACDATNQKAMDKIYKIKKRDKTKLFTVFMDINLVESFVYFVDKNFVYKNLFDGNTVIFNKKPDILPTIKSNTLGIRYPKHDFTHLLLKKLKNPIVATSVNISGQNPICNYAEIAAKFKDIDFVLDNSLVDNSSMSGKPSRIISVVDGNIEVIRE